MPERLIALAMSALLHLALLAALVPHEAAAGAPVPAPAPPESPRKVEIVVLRQDGPFPGLVQADPPPVEAFQREYTDLKIDDSTFDLTAIAARAHVLFPFLSPGVDLDLFQLGGDTDTRRLHYFAAAGPPAARTAAPLRMTPSELQAVVDRAWSRRQRWQGIQAVLRLVDTSDANTGATPRLLRMYAEQNLDQYYEDYNRTSRDRRLWAELSLAADHVRFIGYIRRYVAAHPSTKAATELLFLLDKTAEGNRNILDTLLSTDPDQHLSRSKHADPRAFDLAVELQRYYRDILRARGLDSDAAVTAVYDDVRLAILEGIIRTTPEGYRANDARFLMGEIHWRARRVPQALAAWCQIAGDADDAYAETYRQIQSALRVDSEGGCATPRASAVTQHAIELVFKHRAGQAWDFQFYQLYKFGYRFDTF